MTCPKFGKLSGCIAGCLAIPKKKLGDVCLFGSTSIATLIKNEPARIGLSKNWYQETLCLQLKKTAKISATPARIINITGHCCRKDVQKLKECLL
jgi:hypothetical protein